MNSKKKFKKIYIEITNICNKNCSFCSNDNLPKREMSLKEVEHVFSEVKKVTNYIALHIKGEPLLHSNFKEILFLAEKYELVINLTTNGSLLDKYKDVISEFNSVRQLNISMQSVFEDEIEKVIKTVDYILENNFDINIVYRFWAIEKKLLKIVEQYDYRGEISKENFKLKDRLYVNKHNIFEWPTLNNSFISDRGFCYGMKTHIGILADGTVIPCCLDSSGIIKLGNIFTDSVTDILQSERAINMVKCFQNGKKVEELCQRCNNSVMME